MSAAKYQLKNKKNLKTTDEKLSKKKFYLSFGENLRNWKVFEWKNGFKQLVHAAKSSQWSLLSKNNHRHIGKYFAGCIKAI